jgi:hypothetical protein
MVTRQLLQQRELLRLVQLDSRDGRRRRPEDPASVSRQLFHRGQRGIEVTRWGEPAGVTMHPQLVECIPNRRDPECQGPHKPAQALANRSKTHGPRLTSSRSWRNEE